jgi:hypothetical protein
MNNLLKLLFGISVLFLFFVNSCKNSDGKTGISDEYKGVEPNLQEQTGNTIQEIQEQKIEYPVEKIEFETICATTIIDENVNLFILPTLDSVILGKIEKDEIVAVIGFSDKTETIDGFDGYWVNIFYSDKKGWIFSKHVNLENKNVAEIKFVELIPAQDGKIPLIKLTYILDGKEIFFNTDYGSWNNYYVILWDCYQYGFHYTNKPGIYFLDKETFELKHITYVATSEELPHVWTLFTDDLEYVVQDSGTGPGVRGVAAWRLSDGEKIFSGQYYGMKIDGHVIEVVYSCDDWALERGYTDEEIVAYGKRYREETPVPEDVEEGRQQYGLGVELIIRCSLNLDTGERKIIGGQYILVQ